MIRRYIDVSVPVESCTLRCHYCYITTHRKFASKLPKFKYSPQRFRAGLSRERLGGACFLSFCGGGETLLPPEMPAYFRELLEEGHYVGVVTNGTVDRAFEEILKFPSAFLKRMFFKFSFHYFELKERGLTAKFFANVKRMREAGSAVTVEITPSDELIPHIEEVKKVCLEYAGAWPHVSVARDEREMSVLPILTSLSRDEYIKAWSSFDSELFRFKMTVFGKRLPHFCYAGDWTFNLDMGSGELRQCYFSIYSQNIFDDISKPIKFKAIGHHCLEPHCHNAHVFLGYGDMPELDGTRYDKERNRTCADGTEWLNDEFKDVMHHRLSDANKEYSNIKKVVCDVEMLVRKLKRRAVGKFRAIGRFR